MRTNIQKVDNNWIDIKNENTRSADDVTKPWGTTYYIKASCISFFQSF